MNLVAAIRRQERKLEKQVQELEGRLARLRAAAKALGNSALGEAVHAKKRVLSAAGRAKIAAAARRRWAKVKAGAKKAAS